MSSIEALILRKVQTFTNSLLSSLENEKELNELDKQGRTWNVIQMDGTLMQRGVREFAMRTGTEDQRLLIQE